MCGYAILWILNFVGIQNILVCIFLGTQKLVGNENVWVCVSKLCG